MSCCLTVCERWKQERRGYVPMDIYNAQRGCGGCECGCAGFAEACEDVIGNQSTECGCGCGNNCCG